MVGCPPSWRILILAVTLGVIGGGLLPSQPDAHPRVYVVSLLLMAGCVAICVWSLGGTVRWFIARKRRGPRA